jgi:hypothetical protein
MSIDVEEFSIGGEEVLPTGVRYFFISLLRLIETEKTCQIKGLSKEIDTVFGAKNRVLTTSGASPFIPTLMSDIIESEGLISVVPSGW